MQEWKSLKDYKTPNPERTPERAFNELRPVSSRAREKEMKPILTEINEWEFKNSIIQKIEHPKLFGKYEVFKKNSEEHIGRYATFEEAKKACL